MSKKKHNKRKVRAEFRKKHESRTRQSDFTRDFQEHGFTDTDPVQSERVSGKGELTRKRTILGDATDKGVHGLDVQLDFDESVCQRGRVLAVHGLVCHVQDETGAIVRCATRGVLKSLSTDQRNVVTAGDRVIFRPRRKQR